MSESILFIIGSIVFAITVYGVVMAGGLMLTKRELQEDEELQRRSVDDDLTAGLPLHVKY